jgi:septal ring factor EnvC (AmiA/AmiB activator)
VLLLQLLTNLRKLHIRALEGHDPHAAKIQSLEDDLRLHIARMKDLEDELGKRKHEVDRLRRQTRAIEREREGEAQRVIMDLERQLKEATEERREVQKRLAMEHAASAPSRDQLEIGFGGCIM